MPSIGQVLLLTIMYLSIFSCALPIGHDDVHKDNFTKVMSLDNRALSAKEPAKASSKLPPVKKPSARKPAGTTSALSVAKNTSRQTSLRPASPTRVKTSASKTSSSASLTSSAVTDSSEASTKTSRAKTSSSATVTASSTWASNATLASTAATEASTTEAAAQCPVPKKKPVSKKSGALRKAKDTAKRALNRIRILFTQAEGTDETDEFEYVGLHGTNSKTAEFWETQGFISKPPGPQKGVFDDFKSGFASLLSGAGSSKGKGDGSSGADHELGVGLYVTDDRFTAANFAAINSINNKGTTGKICGIFAKSKAEWRTSITKVLIPKRLNKDFSASDKSTALEKARLNYIGRVVSGIASPESVVKFGNLQLRSNEDQTGQMSIPASLSKKLFAKCIDSEGDQLPPGAEAFPAFTYIGDKLATEWNIVAKDDLVARCVTVEEKLNVVLDKPLPGEDQ